jgi:aldehyde:ferredoxin oxidoreductase
MLPEARMLSVNLTERSFQIEIIPEQIIDAYLGGRGLGAHLLYKTIGPGIDPLSPENPLIFSAGLVQGMSVPFSPKAAVTTKSPLTGIYMYSISSGAIGHSIRKAGYMAVMIRGKAEYPLYLRIADDKVEFCDARHNRGNRGRQGIDSRHRSRRRKAYPLCRDIYGRRKIQGLWPGRRGLRHGFQEPERRDSFGESCLLTRRS